MIPRLSISLLLIAAAGCTTATGPQSVSSTGDKSEAGQARVCRDMSTTGSYGPRRVCHTEAEWKKIDALS